MSEFDIFNSIINEYEQSISNKDIKKNDVSEQCTHENEINESGKRICTDCGIVINSVVSIEKDWRYYGKSDNRYNNDPNRVQARKTEEKSIHKDVDNMSFDENIVNKANQIYQYVTDGKIFRGNSRKAIIFACIFHAYKLSGNPQTDATLLQIFNIKRRSGLKGIKMVNQKVCKKDDVTYITPIHIIKDIMKNFNATEKQIEEVSTYYGLIKNKSSSLNRARPQSTASALVYYWIQKNNKKITLKEFAKTVTLSELTINKILKDIKLILDK